MSETINQFHSAIHSVPETMIQNHGNYNSISLFKIEHNGETFRLPHYNFDIDIYFQIYMDYLKMLMGTSLDFSIFHINDREHTTNLIQLQDKNIKNNTNVEDFINSQFQSRCYSFYICLENTRQYDIERSLITNSIFEGECKICYQTTSLKHYYTCNLKNKINHHGICGSCYISWQLANPDNTCPLCRSPKKNKPST